MVLKLLLVLTFLSIAPLILDGFLAIIQAFGWSPPRIPWPVQIGGGILFGALVVFWCAWAAMHEGVAEARGGRFKPCPPEGCVTTTPWPQGSPFPEPSAGVAK